MPREAPPAILEPGDLERPFRDTLAVLFPTGLQALMNSQSSKPPPVLTTDRSCHKETNLIAAVGGAFEHCLFTFAPTSLLLLVSYHHKLEKMEDTADAVHVSCAARLSVERPMS